jgi:hypothetical protein
MNARRLPRGAVGVSPERLHPLSPETAHRVVLGHLVSEEQLEEITGVARRTWQDWRLRNKGPAYIKAGRLVRYDVETVAQWLAARTVATADQSAEPR